MDYVEQWNRNRVEWLYRLARCKRLDAAAVRVGLLFGTFFQPDEREELKPSYDWIAKNAHMSRGTLSKALVQLEEAGFIQIERMKRYNNMYSMPFDGNSGWRYVEPKSFESKN